jgi:large subunit ribosomal protein L6
MSRIGKHPVIMPAGVTATISGQHVAVKGKNGELSFDVPDNVAIEMLDQSIKVTPRNDDRYTTMMWATARALIQNLVKGVSDGFSRSLELRGVGYRAQLQGTDLVMQLGFSHEIRFPTPAGITIKVVSPTELEISGNSKQQVGQVAADIRGFRPPEPYKGKGVRYKGEVVVMKEGKKK